MRDYHNQTNRHWQFNDLTFEEQDLIAMIRRSERRFGPENTQILVFRGETGQAQLMKEMAERIPDWYSAEEEGQFAYLLLRIPSDPVSREERRQDAHQYLDELFRAATEEDQAFGEDLED